MGKWDESERSWGGETIFRICCLKYLLYCSVEERGGVDLREWGDGGS